MAATYCNLAIVAAYGEGNRVIGKNGRLPDWKLKADMDRFVDLTRGRRLFVTGSTFRPLRNIITRYGRVPVVLTRDRELCHPKAVCVHEYEEVVAYMRDPGGGMVIGGPTLFALAIPYTSCMHLTLVHGAFDGDVHFPYFNEYDWVETWREEHAADADNTHPFTFLTLTRRKLWERTNFQAPL